MELDWLKKKSSHQRSQRTRLLEVANEPRFAAVPPARIVPMLADEGVYLASGARQARDDKQSPWT